MSSPVVKFAPWSDVPVEQIEPLLSRQYIHGEEAMLARIVLKKGCITPRHSHHNEQITYVAEGALLFHLGEDGAVEDKVVRAGETLVIPAHFVHGADAMEDTVIFDIFAPPRQDWLDAKK